VVAGVDEVGRGAWAGPLVACAVVLPLKPRINGVDDSKQLTKRNREYAAAKIMERAICYGFGIVPHDEIDVIGITRANELSMIRALESLQHKPDYVLIDAFKLLGFPGKHASIAHGDATIYSIAAASIVAKVYRDRIMDDYHEEFPQYGFDQHKGYGTEQHATALSVHGICMIHRRSFQPIKTMI
jgi:ribonuclease HII